MMVDLANNQTYVINHIEASNIEFAITTQLARDRRRESQYTSLRLIDNNNGDNIALGDKSIRTRQPK